MTDIICERSDSTELITLNRPASLNALTPGMVADLDSALRSAATDRSCRAIILTGQDDRAFCAGVDVKAVAARDLAAETAAEKAVEKAADDLDEGEALARTDPVVAGFENLHLHLSGIVRTIHVLPIPVIAAVNGHAIGGGFAFAAACDLRVGSTDARFANGFVKRGISGCEMGLSYFLPKIVGPAKAFDWMMSGRRIEPTEALASGLISEVTDPGGLVDRALAMAESLADNAPMAVAMTKEVMWANLHAVSLDQALALESRTQVMTRATADAREARAAFAERRSPSFGNEGGPRPLR